MRMVHKLFALFAILTVVISFIWIPKTNASDVIFYDDFNSGDYSNYWVAGNLSFHYPSKDEYFSTPIVNAWKEENGYLIGTDGINPQTGEPAGGDWIEINTKFKIPARGVIITARVKLEDDSNAVIALIPNGPDTAAHPIIAGADIVAYPSDSGWYAFSGNGTSYHVTKNKDGSVVNGKWYTVKIVIPPNGSKVEVYDGDTGELKAVDDYYTVPDTTAYLVLTARGSWGRGANVTYDYVKVTSYGSLATSNSTPQSNVPTLCNSHECIQFENPPSDRGGYVGKLDVFKVDLDGNGNPLDDPNLFIGDLRGGQVLGLRYNLQWASISGKYTVTKDFIEFVRDNTEAGIMSELRYTLDPTKTMFYSNVSVKIEKSRNDDIIYGLGMISSTYVTSDPGETVYVKGFGIGDNFIDSADPQEVYNWANSLGYNAKIQEGTYTSGYATTVVSSQPVHLVYMKIERPDVGTYYLGIASKSPLYAQIVTASCWAHTKRISFYLGIPNEQLSAGTTLHGEFAVIYARTKDELLSMANSFIGSSTQSQTTTPTQTSTTSTATPTNTQTSTPTQTSTSTSTPTSTLSPEAASAISVAKTIISQVPSYVNISQAKTLLDEAQKAYNNGDYKLAKEFAETAQALAVKSYYDTLYQKLQTEKNSGKDVSKAETLLQQAYQAYQNKDYSKALSILTQADLALQGVTPASQIPYQYILLAIGVVAVGALYGLSRRKGSKAVTQTAPQGPQAQVQTQNTNTTTPSQSIIEHLSELYTDFELIGQGGFAWVYKARRKRDGKVVALKIPKNLDTATGKAFLREISNWLHLKHPNIVELYDANVLPVPFLEMEYCDKPLSKLRKPMDIHQATMIVFNIAEGLKYAHSKGIIHRDLKPSNILLKRGIPKISDWGLSKVMSESRSSTTTTSFTLLYAAPEQLSKSQFGHTDERTDIWSLGVIFYELVTGRLPFDGSDLGEITFSIIGKDPVPPSAINPEAKLVEPIIMKMLAKRKEDRYQSVEELQRDLAKILNMSLVENLKRSQDLRSMLYYAGELALVNLKAGNLSEALKYLLDLQRYTGGRNSDLNWLVEQVKLAAEENVRLGDDALMKADVIIHEIKMGS